MNEMWKLDVNRMRPGIDYKINLQVRVADVFVKTLMPVQIYLLQR